MSPEFPGCIAFRDWFIAIESAAIRVSAKEMVCFISYFVDSLETTAEEAATSVRIFARLTYFPHSLNCSSSFAVEESEDSISAVKVIECILVVVRETFIAYIQGGDQAHFNLVILHLRFVGCSRQFDFRCFADFNSHLMFFICLFIPIYFFVIIKLLHVPLADFENHYQISMNLCRILP